MQKHRKSTITTNINICVRTEARTNPMASITKTQIQHSSFQRFLTASAEKLKGFQRDSSKQNIFTDISWVFSTPIPIGVGAKMPFSHISRNNNRRDKEIGKNAPYLEMTDNIKNFPYVQTTDVYRPLITSHVSHDPNVLEDVMK